MCVRANKKKKRDKKWKWWRGAMWVWSVSQLPVGPGFLLLCLYSKASSNLVRTIVIAWVCVGQIPVALTFNLPLPISLIRPCVTSDLAQCRVASATWHVWNNLAPPDQPRHCDGNFGNAAANTRSLKPNTLCALPPLSVMVNILGVRANTWVLGAMYYLTWGDRVRRKGNKEYVMIRIFLSSLS